MNVRKLPYEEDKVAGRDLVCYWCNNRMMQNDENGPLPTHHTAATINEETFYPLAPISLDL